MLIYKLHNTSLCIYIKPKKKELCYNFMIIGTMKMVIDIFFSVQIFRY